LFFKFIYCTLKKNDYNIINKERNDADIVAKISEKLESRKSDVQATVETFMNEVKIH
jgi:hypothetical protein